jgi:hypothetical protein
LTPHRGADRHHRPAHRGAAAWAGLDRSAGLRCTAFVDRERTWERADVVVDGSGTVPHDPDTEVVIA